MIKFQTIYFLSISILLFTGCLSYAQSPTDKNKFSGKTAMEHLEKQCSFGFRVPGTAPHKTCLEWIKTSLEKNGWKTNISGETTYISMLKKSVTVKNIFGIYNPEAETKILISAHWDTRPIADRDPNPDLKGFPIPGANDGASGVAVLLELARMINESDIFKDFREQKKLGVILAFYDAEDLGSPGKDDEWCIGSKMFAKSIPPELKFIEGINIDMIGDKDLHLPMEGSSYDKYPEFAMEIWKIGQSESSKTFTENVEFSVVDDHSSFFNLKIPYINIIDFQYTYWHTQGDTPDKCSPYSLQTVGNTLVKYIQTRAKNPKKTLEK